MCSYWARIEWRTNQMKSFSYIFHKMSNVESRKFEICMSLNLYVSEKVIYFLLLDRKKRKPSYEDDTEVSIIAVIKMIICYRHRCDQIYDLSSSSLSSKLWSVIIKLMINQHRCEGNGASTLRLVGPTKKADWPLQDERCLLQVIIFI